MQMTTCAPRYAMKRFNRSNRLFDDFFAPINNDLDNAALHVRQPVVDVYEKEDVLVIEAELPGLEKKDIKVDVKGRYLTLSGERENQEEVKEEGSYRRERRNGKFARTFRLPNEVTEKEIEAQYLNGVLTLRIEKPEEQKPKQITIN